MNYTENYQLPQWAESDRVLMADFNSLNSKLDTALWDLEQRKSECKQLKQETLSRQQSNWTVSLSGINCGAWQFLLLDIALKGTGAYVLRPNGSADVAYRSPGSSSTNGGFAQLQTGDCWNILLLPFYSNDRIITSLSLSPDVILGRCNFSNDISYGTLSSFQLFPSSDSATLSAGSRFTIWGI